MTTYDDLVVTDRMTCQACPTQWEGELKDGRKFYFRYRWGGAMLGVHVTDPIGATFNSHITDGQSAYLDIGDGLDGSMEDDEYRETFVRLFEQLQ